MEPKALFKPFARTSFKIPQESKKHLKVGDNIKYNNINDDDDDETTTIIKKINDSFIKYW